MKPTIEEQYTFEKLAEELLELVHQPQPTDSTQWFITPGKKKEFNNLINRIITYRARKLKEADDAN